MPPAADDFSAFLAQNAYFSDAEKDAIGNSKSPFLQFGAEVIGVSRPKLYRPIHL